MTVDLERQTRAAIDHLERIGLYLELGADDQIRLAIAGHPKAQAFDGTGTTDGAVSDPVGNDVAARKAVDKARSDARLIARTLGRIQRDARLIANTLAPYVPASNDERNRLDPTDYCRLHWTLQLYEGHRRHKGDMCKLCNAFHDVNGRGPTLTEADHFHRHGRWPHKLVDPKARKAV